MENTVAEKKQCLFCNKKISGRTDKKFCNDYCRNVYNNQVNGFSNNTIRNINNIMGKNRRILNAYVKDGEMARIKKDEIVSEGFRFKYFTNIQETKTGATLFCCYDVGYICLDEENVLITRL